MNITILGLDVGRNFAMGIILKELPSNIKRFYAEKRHEFFRIKPAYQLTKKQEKSGFKDFNYLESLGITGIVMEPTGLWYSAIWQAWGAYHNIPIYWVGHADLSCSRGHYGFTNKSDPIDALTLACLYFDDRWVDDFGNKKWLSFYSEKIYQLRRIYFDITGIEKDKTRLIAQSRQRLCYEFPESSERRIQKSEKLGFSPFWGWLGGSYSYSRIVNLYQNSAAKRLEIPMSRLTQLKGQHITQLETQITELETSIMDLMCEPEFSPYLAIFRKFNFGFDNQMLLLLQCYPFSKFLIDGMPWIEWEETEKGRKKRDRSLRRFQGYLGMAFHYKQSGDKNKRAYHGSSLVRSKLFMWCLDVVLGDFRQTFRELVEDPNLKIEDGFKISHHKIIGGLGEKLAKKALLLYRSGVKGNDVPTRLLFYVTRLLYQELVRSFCKVRGN